MSEDDNRPSLQELLERKNAEARECRVSSTVAGKFVAGGGNAERAMTMLAGAFPVLRNADGIEPFDAHALDAWCGQGASHGERCVVQFLLSVWNPDDSRGGVYECGVFDVHEALKVWDLNSQQAFAGWAEDPWWP